MSPRAAARLESLGFTRVHDYVGGKTDWLAAGLPREGTLAHVPLAGDIADQAPICRLGQRLRDARERAEQAGSDVCAVVDHDGVVMGLLRREQLDGPDETQVEQAMRPGPSTVRAS